MYTKTHLHFYLGKNADLFLCVLSIIEIWISVVAIQGLRFSVCVTLCCTHFFVFGDEFMKSDLEMLRDETNAALNDLKNISNQTQEIEKHLSQVADEYYRVAKLSGQAGYVLDNIDKEFQEKTKLQGWEIVLLFTCTALQCIRQYLLSNDKFRMSAKSGDEFMDNSIGEIVKPEWKDVLFQSVPYDATQKGVHIKDNIGLSGTTHRYRTLGHDPLLGWVFGTANIMTNSLTKYNFETFQVKDMCIIRHYPLGVFGMLEKATTYAQSDPKLLAASLGRQFIHFGSDFFTNQGLPIPLISTVNNDLAKEMITKWNIDTYSFLRGMSLSALINSIIFLIHQFFYDENRDGSKQLYEVKTRKILSYSNLIATSSNVLITAITGNKKLFDLGGFVVTILRLVSDYNFIHHVKQEFLQKEFYNQVVGKQYNFMEV